ncbi:hypothetical protein SAMN04488564_112207 [Lentzea waywayandensis]|uniref:Uncharacterized protein n=1 Tax=Lentzea waywayandensis TaxID=84724 RepID=A0A1I6FDP9_9PSEU|nr:hypothetical protein [Lentzea waywayandensis]SFR28096.1 hypothetical protein SAMN04488564_112207 [Lentzea waywayandensis]
MRGEWPDGTSFTGRFLTAERLTDGSARAELHLWLTRTTIPQPLPGNGQFPGIRVTAVVPPPLADRVLAAADGLTWPDDAPATLVPIITLSIDLDDVAGALYGATRGAFELVQATCDQITRTVRAVVDGESPGAIASPLRAKGSRTAGDVAGWGLET